MERVDGLSPRQQGAGEALFWTGGIEVMVGAVRQDMELVLIGLVGAAVGITLLRKIFSKKAQSATQAET